MAINTKKPYTDPGLTYDRVADGPLPTQVIADNPAKNHVHKLERAYDEAGTVRDGSESVQTDPPPHKPKYWPLGQDPYKNNGMPGQDYLNNQA